MKIQVLSDLHMEFSHYQINVVEDAEVLVIAGDFTMAGSLEDLEGFIRSVEKPVVFVAGNHEYYEGAFDVVNWKLDQLDSTHPNFHFLNNRGFTIGEVQFIGSTLWSNFDLASDPFQFAQLAESKISDFQVISRSLTSRFLPEDCMSLNKESRLFLRDELRSACNKKKVVVTHFCPSPQSIHPKYKGNILNPFFVCNCEDLMRPNVVLWIHGHTHDSFDYRHGGTHVVANPKGYYDENQNFQDRFIVDV